MGPFGFINAQATFMCLGNNVFSRYLDKFVLVFLDDTLTYSKNEEEHVEQLRLILKLLRKHKLYSKLSRCDFCEYRIHYSGHIISDRGISVDPKKIDSMMIWPAPRKLTKVISFMGLAGYCRKFTEEDFAGKVC